jgi:hypothetical protein
MARADDSGYVENRITIMRIAPTILASAVACAPAPAAAAPNAAASPPPAKK